jgi:hypothetical protein
MLLPLPTSMAGREPGFRPGPASALGANPSPEGPAGAGPWPVPRDVAEAVQPRGACYGVPSEPGWVRCDHLIAAEGVTESLARVARAHPGASPEVAASYLVNWYSAAVVAPAIASYVLLRRVPHLNPSVVSLHVPDSGWFDRTALHFPAGAMLADDPWATPAATSLLRVVGGPRTAVTGPAGVARVVADLPELRAVLVEEVLAHLRPFIQELRARVRLGRPALWGAAAAQCARSFLLTERVSADPTLGRDEADAFFTLAAPTMLARPRWQEFVHRGRSYVGMRRGSCCLAHRMDEEYCTTCPFTDDLERERRMRTWIDTQGDGGLAV